MDHKYSSTVMGKTIEEIKAILERQARNLEAFGYRREEYFTRIADYIEQQKKARLKQDAMRKGLEGKTNE